MARDDLASDIRRLQDLRLVKAFLKITDARRRQRIIELAEQLAEDAELNAAGFAAAEASAMDKCREVPDRIK